MQAALDVPVLEPPGVAPALINSLSGSPLLQTTRSMTCGDKVRSSDGFGAGDTKRVRRELAAAVQMHSPTEHGVPERPSPLREPEPEVILSDAMGQLVADDPTGELCEVMRAVSLDASPLEPPGVTRKLKVDDPHVMQVLLGDRSPFALRPDDPEELAEMCRDVFQHIDRAQAPATLDAEKSAWKHWVAFAEHMNTPAWRADAEANAGMDRGGAQREALMLAMALVFVYRRMKPRSSRDPAPKPNSAMAVLRHIRRMHARRGVPMANLKMANMALKGLLRMFVDVHGHEWLIPERKEPFTNEDVQALYTYMDGTAAQSATEEAVVWKAVVGVLAKTGFRKAEVAVQNGRKWGRRNLSRASVVWRIGGWDYANPTIEQLRALTEMDFMIIKPPPSKADQFAAVWGASPVYIRFRKVPGNAAWAVQQMEIRVPVTAARKDTPLFAVDGEAVSYSWVEGRLQRALLHIKGDPEVARRYSVHSFRVYLACALLACGASEARIQALCRWQTNQSLAIYARLNDREYAAWLDRAATADVSSVRTRNLPETDEWRQVAALGQFNMRDDADA